MKYSNKSLQKHVEEQLDTVQQIRLAALCKKIERLANRH